MGTYGTYSGIIRWYDAVNRKGHLLALQDGEALTDITDTYWASGATGFDEGSGFWLDRQFTPGTTIAVGEPVGLLLALTYAAEVVSPATGVTRLFFGDSGGNKVKWDGDDLVIVGNITATSGSFGGWTINSTYLAKDTGTNATSAGMAPLDYPFYSGATYANRASATFRVTPAGDVHMESGDLAGWALSSAAIYKDGATAATSAGMAPADYPFYAGAKYADRATATFRVAPSGDTYLGYINSNSYVRIRPSVGLSDIVTIRGAGDGETGIDIALTNEAWYGINADVSAATSDPVGGMFNAVGTAGSGVHGAQGVVGWASVSSASGWAEGVQGLANITGGTPTSIYGVIGKSTTGYGVGSDGPLRIISSFAEFVEISDPAAPASNEARLYVKDNGSGKTQLCVRFSSGAVQVIATQP